MKQFQYVSGRSGVMCGPFTAEEVAARFPVSRRGVVALRDEATYTDADGDVWSVVPDLGEAPIVVTDQTARDERLERIATAVLTGLAAIPNNSLHLTVEDVIRIDVERAIVYAKALIAELDKQA